MAKKTAAALKANQFSVNNKVYQLNFDGSIIVPGIGVRTNAEILVDEEAQQILVSLESGFITEYIQGVTDDIIVPPAGDEAPPVN